MQHIGTVIKNNRLLQNLSQESLCEGICVVSYLSKIENGLVHPNQEIIKQLFQALQIKYCDDQVFLLEAKQEFEKLFQYWNRLEYEKANELYKKLQNQENSLLYSVLSIEINCCQCFYQNDVKRFMNLFEETMKNPLNLSELSLKYCYYVFGEFYTRLPNRASYLSYLINAVRLFSDFIFTCYLGNAYFHKGDYQKAILTLHDALQVAIKEGNYQGMIYSCIMLGNSYSCLRSMDLMRQYYEQAIHLAGIEHESVMSDCNYNLAATYLQQDEYELARKHFDVCLAYDERKSTRNNFFLYHRRALLAIALKEDATEFVQLAKNCTSELQDDLNQEVMDWLVIAYENQNYLHNEAYTKHLEHIIKIGEDRLGFGFIMFYSHYLIEAFKVNRRYKEALNLHERISFH